MVNSLVSRWSDRIGNLQPSISDFRGSAKVPLTHISPLIVAGDPNPGNSLFADSPTQRIDPNVATSPYAGVGSLDITAPGQGTFLCSGAMISPYHVLTAAHCLDIANEDGIVDVLPQDVIFNLNAQGESAPPMAIAASALNVFDIGTARYEGFSNSLNNDLAIVTLSGEVPAGIPIYELARDTPPLQSTITLVGYGTTGNGIDGHIAGTASSTVKRVGQNQLDDTSVFAASVSQVNEIFLYDFDGPDASSNSFAATGSGLTLGNQLETTVGPGDSGGPSFITNGTDLTLVGVNTFGFVIPNASTPLSTIAQGSFGTGAGGVLVSDPNKLAWIDGIVGTNLGMVPASGSIQGVIWEDLNGDGDRDPTEPTLPGWTVYLDLNTNGVLDIDEPSTITDITGTYQFSSLDPGTYTVAQVLQPGWRQTFPVAGPVELFSADFSSAGAPSLDGFSVDNTGAPVPGLWHLTTGRGAQPGHSPDDSLYFGQAETAIGGGNYDVGQTAGRVTTPEIDLRGLTSAELTFNYFLNVEPDLARDQVQVLVSEDNGPFQIIADKANGLVVASSTAPSWSAANLDLNNFLGSTIQVQFVFDTVDGLVNNLEGWFIDDVVVQGAGSDRHTVTLNTGQIITDINFGNRIAIAQPQNIAPVAMDDSFALNEDDLLSGNVLSNDSDPNQDPLTASLLSAPNNGVVTFSDDGSFEYTPESNFNGVDSFTYRVSDGNLTDTATVNLTIAPVNDAPVAADDIANTSLDTAVTIAVLNNDSDVDGDPLTISSVSAPTNGIVAINGNNTLTYTPVDGFSGTDSFTYTIVDDQGSQATATVNLAVDNIALPAVAEVQGFLDYERFLTYQADGQAIATPANTIGGLPLAQLFDETAYLYLHPDVVAAIAAGQIASGYEHFVSVGIAEGRSPGILYDEAFYLANNGDVAQALDNGLFASGLEHFLAFGHQEGRDPSSRFNQADYLLNNPDIAAAVGSGAFQSAFEHYIEFGIDENRLPFLSLYNEDYYLRNNLDVASAQAEGAFASGYEHFVRFGQYEGRNPSQRFDQASYLAANPDVQVAVDSGLLASAFAHYEQFGRFEERAMV